MSATVTISGTVSQPRLKTVQQGSTGTTYGTTGGLTSPVFGSGGTDMDSRYCLQKDLNFFQEFQAFIAEMARVCSMTPVACMDQLAMMLHEMRRQPAMGERVFAP